ncbi:MAG TPA: hypothetical protein DHW71_01940 [Gammaproteobacteria bacterium]|nr:hypothetical protein [Gammaproteobacteria bacterium]MBK83382.1 hypothetical protein [Gammaproteobacteria bacterium]HBF08084.1 hypothetical protein [Gammaproteobacteria bacterium]HCK91715.1 hypothetical protein [Gammaproteobacteria bacterium]|tara:strand:+ start:1703 stop:2158 length:456 start_codon:yes stop_codon:yes gene_type:complete
MFGHREKMTKNWILLCMFCSFGLVMPAIAAADVYVIMSNQSDIQELSKEEVRYIYFSKILTIDNKPVNLIAYDLEDENIRSSFYKSVSGKSLRQMSSYWARMVYSGRGKPPEALKVEEMLSKVLENPNAIGYVPSMDVIQGQAVSVIYHIE